MKGTFMDFIRKTSLKALLRKERAAKRQLKRQLSYYKQLVDDDNTPETKPVKEIFDDDELLHSIAIDGLLPKVFNSTARLIILGYKL